MIDNAALETILETASDFSIVCEIYPSDAVPSSSGFDPGDALKLYAAVDGIEFVGNTYTRLVKKFGNISRSLRAQANSATVEFSNVSREISRFEFSDGFEGLIMVIRLISRSQSTTLAKSEILFTGRCEQPSGGNKDALTVKANWILGDLRVTVPRRKYTKEDQDGRVSTDPDFEGFIFIPQEGVATYSVRVKRGGFAGLFGFKKTVQKTLTYSSISNLDANKSVPLVLGQAQLEGTHIAYVDVGAAIRLRTAFADGPGHDLLNVRSLDANFPLSGTSYAEAYGDIGAANGPDDPAWVGPGNYSRTMHIRGQADNSLVSDTDPAPTVIGIVQGMLVTIPDGSGDWVTTDEYTDDGAAHTRYLLTSEDYFNLDENWMDDDDFYETYQFNTANIIDRSLTDFIFTSEG